MGNLENVILDRSAPSINTPRCKQQVGQGRKRLVYNLSEICEISPSPLLCSVALPLHTRFLRGLS